LEDGGQEGGQGEIYDDEYAREQEQQNKLKQKELKDHLD
jgi:hypothetical protein